MLKLWENPMLSIEDRLEAANGEIERLKLEIKRTPEVWARTIIERKPKTHNALAQGLGEEPPGPAGAMGWTADCYGGRT